MMPNFIVFEIFIKYRTVASFTCKHSRSGNTLEILIFARLDYEYIYKKSARFARTFSSRASLAARFARKNQRA